MSNPSPLHQLAAQHFDKRYKCKQSESSLNQPDHTIWVSRHSFCEPNIYIWVFLFEAAHNFCKLQRLLQFAKFLFMYSFTLANIAFLFRHLPTEIVISISICYKMKCFSGDNFSFFRSRFC